MNPTWQILPDRLTADLFSRTSVQSPDTARTVHSGYAGRGIMRPFRRSKNGDFDIGEGERLTRAAVGLVLGTVCQSAQTSGELPWRTEFGSLLPLLRLRNLDTALQGLSRVYVSDALRKWVTSIRIVDTSIHVPTENPEALILLITYDIVDPPNARVIVPGVQTAVQLG